MCLSFSGVQGPEFLSEAEMDCDPVKSSPGLGRTTSGLRAVVAPPCCPVIKAQMGPGETRGHRAWYSLHEFTGGPLRAESHEVIDTDDSPRVPVPAQGACGSSTGPLRLSPVWGTSSCPSTTRALPTLPPRGQSTRTGLQMLALTRVQQGRWGRHTASQILVSWSEI